MSVRCDLCQQPIEPNTPYYRRCVGWEHKAVAGSRKGGSDIVLREHLDEFACWSCIYDRKHHRSSGQTSLI